ncbi:MAG: hypothetical protein JWR22_1389, partial [Herminiimonas sp.]|nr:hypothetical protein [Herminiimonas sp.]MDB5853348.1 hypothetical protein [Herminiimonas sp.]
MLWRFRSGEREHGDTRTIGDSGVSEER